MKSKPAKFIISLSVLVLIMIGSFASTSFAADEAKWRVFDETAGDCVPVEYDCIPS